MTIYSFPSIYGKIEFSVETLVHPSQAKRYRTIDLEKFDYFTELKISSTSFSYREIKDMFPNDYNVSDLCKIWKRWNNNGEHFGTKLQNRIVSEFCGATNQKETYELGLKILARHNLVSDRGYTYGSEYLIEYIPVDVANKLNVVITNLQDQWKEWNSQI